MHHCRSRSQAWLSPSAAEQMYCSVLISRIRDSIGQHWPLLQPWPDVGERGNDGQKEQMHSALLAARLCPVGDKVNMRVRSLGNVLEGCGSAPRACGHCRRVMWTLGYTAIIRRPVRSFSCRNTVDVVPRHLIGIGNHSHDPWCR